MARIDGQPRREPRRRLSACAPKHTAQHAAELASCTFSLSSRGFSWTHMAARMAPRSSDLSDQEALLQRGSATAKVLCPREPCAATGLGWLVSEPFVPGWRLGTCVGRGRATPAACTAACGTHQAARLRASPHSSTSPWTALALPGTSPALPGQVQQSRVVPGPAECLARRRLGTTGTPSRWRSCPWRPA